MYLATLDISGFRNLADQGLAFDPKINWIVGDNGQGKTNLLEAIHFVCMGKSHRMGAGEKDLIGFGKDWFRLSAKALKDEVPNRVSIGLNRNGEKSIRLDDRSFSRMSDFIGALNVVSFSPEDIALVRGGAAVRRAFLDMLLCQTDSSYLCQLQQYRRDLRERNFLLRDGSADPVLLETYTEKLVQKGSRILLARREALTLLSAEAAGLFCRLAPAFGSLRLRYRHRFLKDENAPFAEDLQRAFASLAAREKRQGETLVGPHRDDLEIDLNGIALRSFGSQGQCRAAAIAIRLSAIEYIKKCRSQYPILLLDDIFSELDEHLCKGLREMLYGTYQIFLASPRMDFPANGSASFCMRAGVAETTQEKQK